MEIKNLTEWEPCGFYEAEDIEEYVDCDYCGKSKLKNQYSIVHCKTSKEKIVGSECIKQFELVYHGKQLKTDKEKDEVLKHLKDNHVILCLEKLGELDFIFKSRFMTSYVSYYENNNKFTVKQMKHTLSLLHKYKIRFIKSKFKVKFDEWQVLEFKKLKNDEKVMIKEVMTDSQKRKIIY